MKLSLDSSSFAKRYVQEEGSDALDGLLLSASDLALSVIVVPEILSGLNRRLREGSILTENYRRAKEQLLADVRDATVIQLTPAVVSRSVRLLEMNTLRAMDALHLACALEWKTDLFVTSDKRQFDAAVNSGLKTRYLGHQNG